MLKSYKTLQIIVQRDKWPHWFSKEVCLRYLEENDISEEELDTLIEELKNKAKNRIAGLILNVLTILISSFSLLLSGASFFYRVYSRFEDNLGRELPTDSLLEKNDLLIADLNSVKGMEKDLKIFLFLFLIMLLIVVILGLLDYCHKRNLNNILSYLYAYKRELIQKSINANSQ